MAERRAQVATPRRGEIYLVGFDPTFGAEIKKTRPALVIQNDSANRTSPITIVAAITSTIRVPLYPVQVLVPAGEGGLVTDSAVLLNQIRSTQLTGAGFVAASAHSTATGCTALTRRSPLPLV